MQQGKRITRFRSTGKQEVSPLFWISGEPETKVNKLLQLRDDGTSQDGGCIMNACEASALNVKDNEKKKPTSFISQHYATILDISWGGGGEEKKITHTSVFEVWSTVKMRDCKMEGRERLKYLRDIFK